jgi:outer membrane protein assembly factor BamD
MGRVEIMFRRLSSLTPLAAVFALALVAGCSSDDEEEYVERPVDQIYNQAVDALQQEEFETAAQLFDEVERQHPYSRWATQAQLMAAYAHYQKNQYDDAIVALDRFIQLHPSNKSAPYAYYLKGLSYYEQISDVARDQEMTRLARATFKELIARHPNSRFARDAKVKLDLTHDHLAGKDMEIGRQYLRKQHYLAAIERFKRVIANFETTTHVPEALHRLSEAYTALGLVGEARKVAAVLGHNFPGSEWYIDSYELVEGKIVRPREDDPWYKFWNWTSETPQVGAPIPEEEIEKEEEKEPWYKIW